MSPTHITPRSLPRNQGNCSTAGNINSRVRSHKIISRSIGDSSYGQFPRMLTRQDAKPQQVREVQSLAAAKSMRLHVDGMKVPLNFACYALQLITVSGLNTGPFTRLAFGAVTSCNSPQDRQRSTHDQIDVVIGNDPVVTVVVRCYLCDNPLAYIQSSCHVPVSGCACKVCISSVTLSACNEV